MVQNSPPVAALQGLATVPQPPHISAWSRSGSVQLLNLCLFSSEPAAGSRQQAAGNRWVVLCDLDLRLLVLCGAQWSLSQRLLGSQATRLENEYLK